MRSIIHTTAYSILALALILMTGCVKEDWTSTSEAQETVVSFSLSLDRGIDTRAIADGELINQLIVVAKDSQTGAYQEVYRGGMTTDLKLRLISGRTYNIVFWAQNEDAYTVSDGKVSAEYTGEVLDGGFSIMESLDAFSASRTVEVGKQQSDVVLYRSVAQINFADNSTAPLAGTHKAVVTFSNIPTSLDLFTGEVTTKAEKEFTFADFTGEKLTANNSEYHYVASHYILAPSTGKASVEAALDLQNIDGTSIKTLEFKGEKAISITANKRTNILGSIVEIPVTVDKWDGITLTEPATDPVDENRYIIDSASDLAWMQTGGKTLEENRTFVLTTDLDMAGKELAPIQLPDNSTIISKDGKVRTIKNLTLGGGSIR